jgi:hypothetical protein
MSESIDPAVLEKEQGFDMKSAELTEAYKKDTATINECINKLVDIREDRTTQYEMDLLKLKGEYEANRL